MEQPKLLLHKKNQIALEEILKQEAHKFVTRSTGRKILDKTKQYCGIFLAPNIIAGSLGYVLGGGLDASIEAMTDVSRSVLPGILFIQGMNEVIQAKLPLNNINYVIEQKRTELIKVLKFVENAYSPLIATLTLTALNSGAFYGFSSFMEMITKTDYNQGLMTVTGAFLGLLSAFLAIKKTNDTRNRIINYAQNNVKDIEQKKGRKLELIDLENLVRGVLNNSDEADKIYVASSEKRFRGIGGALGFLGALDQLNDKQRDPTRVKPNITLNVKENGFGYRGVSPIFRFDYKREISKTNTALELAKLIYTRVSDVEIEIHPVWKKTSLNEFISAPYEHLTTIYIRGKKDDAQYFEINYDFEDDKDEVSIEINTREHLGIALEMFRHLVGRPLQDTDFDNELMALSENYDGVKNTQMIFQNMERELNNPDADPDEFDIAEWDDALERLKPKRNEYNYPVVFGDKEKKAPEKPEEPLQKLDKIAEIILSIYKANRNNIILNRREFASLHIAFEGMLYSLSPLDSEKGRTLRTVLRAFDHPIKTIISLITQNEVLPSLEKAEITAQIPGISAENVYELIRILERKTQSLEIRPCMRSIDYKTFWKISENLQIIPENAYDIELTDGKGTKIEIYFGEPKESYKTIRAEHFPAKKELETLAEEIRKARENEDHEKFGAAVLFHKSRVEKELEKPTYQIVAETEGIPSHIIICNKDDGLPFMQNRTVSISTKDKLFIDNPVHPKEGIQRITKYFIALRDAVQEVKK